MTKDIHDAIVCDVYKSTHTNVPVCIHDLINEPQLSWLQTAIYHMGLNVKNESHQCTYTVCTCKQIQATRKASGDTQTRQLYTCRKTSLIQTCSL